MANNIPINVSSVFGGLGTATATITTAGLYTCEFQSSIPYRAAGSSNNSAVTSDGSSLQVVINQNGSPKLTVSSPGVTQPMVAGSVKMNCAAADVITVVLTSAAAVDNALNAIKTMINLYQGE